MVHRKMDYFFCLTRIVWVKLWDIHFRPVLAQFERLVMRKFAVILAAIAAMVLFQGLTAPSPAGIDRILADASLAMGLPLFFVAIAFWASQNDDRG
jgi:hypothetical protein